MTAAYIADTDAPGPRPARPRAAGRRDDRPDRRADRGADRARQRLRGRGRRLLPRAQRRRATASSRTATSTQMDQGEGVEGAAAQGGPARLRALEGAEGGRGHRLGRALGARPAGLAHRVLGDGRGAARRRLRHPRRRQRPRLPAPRERGGADARRRAAPSSRASGCTTGCSSSAARRWPSPSATSPCCTRCSTRWGRDALILFFCGGHYRQPLASPTRRWRRRGAASQRIREAGRRLVAGASPDELAPLRERFFAALADDFNTPRALAAVLELGARGEPPRGRPATRDLREMLGVLGLENLLDAGDGRRARRGRLALLARREQARAAKRLRRRPTACATSSPRSAGTSATARAAASSSARVILYGRNAGARGAARRAPAACTRSGRRGAAAEEPWLRERAASRSSAPTRSSASRGSERPPGRLRRGRRLSVRRRAPSCCEAPDPLIVALDEVQDPQNLGAIARTAEGAGATGVVIPERRSRRGHAGGLQGVGGRGRAPARSRGCATSPTSWPTPRRAGCWCYGADAEPAGRY